MLLAACADPCPGGATEPPTRAVARWNPTAALRLHRPGDTGRLEVEDFIRDVYARRYGARLSAFAPTLVSLRGDSGEVLAAAGYRPAAVAPLFLERYLAQPVEALLSPRDGPPVARASVVEVGHLAACRAGEGRRLIRTLAPHLAEAGHQWVVSTVTRELLHLFGRLGVVPLPLAPARAAALGADAGEWGRYYQHGPQVMAGFLPRLLGTLARGAR